MSAITTCDNPMCACEPCACDDCSCGAARLGELERRVMDILWEEPDRELSGRDVADALPDYAYTTVATVLDRLVHKGLVHRRMDGRTIRFTTVGTRGAHTAVLMHEALAADHDADAACSLCRDPVALGGRRPSPGAQCHRTARTEDRRVRSQRNLLVSGNALRSGHADHGHEGRPERMVVEQSKRPIDVPVR